MPVLWGIGLDEVGGVIGADINELADWFRAAAACFDGGAPAIFDLNVTVVDKTMVALLFRMDRAPYVVEQ